VVSIEAVRSTVPGHKSEENLYGTLPGIFQNLCPMTVSPEAMVTRCGKGKRKWHKYHLSCEHKDLMVLAQQSIDNSTTQSTCATCHSYADSHTVGHVLQDHTLDLLR